MGFFSKLLNKKTTVQKSKTESFKVYTIQELSALLREKKEKLKENSTSELKPIYKDIKQISRNIIQEAERLRSAQVDPEMFKSLSSTLRNAKQLYIDGIEHNINNILNIELNKYEDCVGASKKFFSCITAIHILEKKGLRFVNFGYRENIVELRKYLNNLAVSSDDFLNKIKETEKDITLNEALLELLVNYTALTDKLNSIEETIRLTRERIKKPKLEKKKYMERLHELESSSEKEIYIKLENELETIQEKKNKLERQVVQSLGQLVRPLKKYKRLVEGLGEKAFVEYVDTCITNPKNILSKPACANELLNKLNEAVESNKISFDAKEKEKTLSTIKRCLNNDIDAIIKQYVETEMAEKAKEDELDGSVYSNKKTELENQLSKLNEKIETDEKHLESIETERTKLQKELKEVKKKILENDMYKVKLK